MEVTNNDLHRLNRCWLQLKKHLDNQLCEPKGLKSPGEDLMESFSHIKTDMDILWDIGIDLTCTESLESTSIDTEQSELFPWNLTTDEYGHFCFDNEIENYRFTTPT